MIIDRFYPRAGKALAGALSCAILCGTPAIAATTVRATVDARGTLRFSKATLKALGVRTADGMVAVELPFPPRPLKTSARRPATTTPVKPGTTHVHGPQCDHQAYEGPPRLFVSVRPDGSLELRKQKLPGTKIVVPGAPGTAFLATANKGKLILARSK